MGITSRGYWTDLSPYGLYHCLNIRAHLHCSHHGGAPTTGAPGAKKGHSTCCGRSQTSKFVQPTTWDGWTKSLGLRENSRKPRVFTSMFLVVPVETVFFLASILRGVPKALNFIIQVSEPILCRNGKLMFILVCGLTQSQLKTKLTDCKDCASIWWQIVW